MTIKEENNLAIHHEKRQYHKHTHHHHNHHDEAEEFKLHSLLSMKVRKKLAKILFMVLCILATLIIAACIFVTYAK